MSGQRIVIVAAFVAVAAVLAPAQCGSLATTLLGSTFCTNGGGPMFDVVALHPAGVRVSGFSARLTAGTHTISIYAITGGGTFVGQELNPAAWTLLESATVVSTGTAQPTLVPLIIDVPIANGATQGFHVRAGAGGLYYASSTTLGPVGSILVSNADLQILVGSTQCTLAGPGGPPFQGSVPSPRAFNGAVHYNAEFQVNRLEAHLDLDGVQGTFCMRAVVMKSQGASTVLNLQSTNIGQGWEAAIAVAPLIPASLGAPRTSSGQIFNVFLTGGVTFVNGGTLPTFTVPFSGNLALPFTAPLQPLTASIQMAVLDPMASDGFYFSQGAELIVQ